LFNGECRFEQIARWYANQFYIQETYEKLLTTSIAKQDDDFKREPAVFPKKSAKFEEDISKETSSGLTAEAIEAIMEVLISRDVLYEPLVNLDKSVYSQGFI
jgi:hypothetical protein